MFWFFVIPFLKWSHYCLNFRQQIIIFMHNMQTQKFHPYIKRTNIFSKLKQLLLLYKLPNWKRSFQNFIFHLMLKLHGYVVRWLFVSTISMKMNILGTVNLKSLTFVVCWLSSVFVWQKLKPYLGLVIYHIFKDSDIFHAI